MTQECQHPLASLEVDVGGTGQRGKSSMSHVVCRACKGRFPEAAGVRVLVDALRVDHSDVWDALSRAGVMPRDRPPGRQDREIHKKKCAHHLAWIRVETSGIGVRGAAGLIQFRCAGCKQAWSQQAGLKVFLDLVKLDRDRIHRALRKIGVPL